MDHRLVKNRFQRCPVPAFHKFMVPKIGVVVKGKDNRGCEKRDDLAQRHSRDTGEGAKIFFLTEN